MAGSFALDLSRFAKKANGRMTLVIRKVAIDIFTRVVQMTPVDTGRARANWSVGVNKFPIQTTEETDKSGDETIRKIEAAVATAKAGDVIFLVNSLPYIRMLEYGGYGSGPKTIGGFSIQAPAGMIRVVLAEYPGVINTAVASS